MAQLNVNDVDLNAGYGSQAPIFGCRAWVNFDGTATYSSGSDLLCVIHGSSNVSKVVRTNGPGGYVIYTVHFETAMPDANYAAIFGSVAKAGTTGGYNITVSERITQNNSAQTRLRTTTTLPLTLNLSNYAAESISVAIIR